MRDGYPLWEGGPVDGLGPTAVAVHPCLRHPRRKYLNSNPVPEELTERLGSVRSTVRSTSLHSHPLVPDVLACVCLFGRPQAGAWLEGRLPYVLDPEYRECVCGGISSCSREALSYSGWGRICSAPRWTIECRQAACLRGTSTEQRRAFLFFRVRGWSSALAQNQYGSGHVWNTELA